MKNISANIALYGFMGSGKSTIGRLLSNVLDVSFVDLDLQIEETYDMSIADMFSVHGEDVFRAREESVLASLAYHPPHILALGGGTLLTSRNKDFVCSSYRLFTFSLPFSIVKMRLNSQERPLASQAEQLYEDRLSHYQGLGSVIELTDETPQDCVHLILEDLRAA